MSTFEAQDPAFESRVRDSFAQQTVMSFIGAKLTEIRPGFCEIPLPYRNELSQQDGFFHGGMMGTIADSAGGYAAFTLMSADSRVLTVEYKLNLLAPGDGDMLIARGQVLRCGRTLSVSRADVVVTRDGMEKICASLLQTLISLPDPGTGA